MVGYEEMIIIVTYFMVADGGENQCRNGDESYVRGVRVGLHSGDDGRDGVKQDESRDGCSCVQETLGAILQR